MKKEVIAQLVNSGLEELDAALAAGNSVRLERLLAMMALFRRYSFNNCLLIAQQRPDATMVLGFHGWKKLGRSVIKGEKGIGITAPMAYRKKDASDGQNEIRGFRIVHVFDVHQTEGQDLPEFAEPRGEATDWIEPIERLIRSKGIQLEYRGLGSGVYGLSARGRIIIQSELSDPRKAATLIHELSHELLHPDIESRRVNSTRVKETEAEAVAHVVCSALGLECLDHSADYIHLHRGDSSVLADSMQRIQKCSSDILNDLLEPTHSPKCRSETDEGSQSATGPTLAA